MQLRVNRLLCNRAQFFFLENLHKTGLVINDTKRHHSAHGNTNVTNKDALSLEEVDENTSIQKGRDLLKRVPIPNLARLANPENITKKLLNAHFDKPDLKSES